MVAYYLQLEFAAIFFVWYCHSRGPMRIPEMYISQKLLSIVRIQWDILECHRVGKIPIEIIIYLGCAVNMLRLTSVVRVDFDIWIKYMNRGRDTSGDQ